MTRRKGNHSKTKIHKVLASFFLSFLTPFFPVRVLFLFYMPLTANTVDLSYLSKTTLFSS